MPNRWIEGVKDYAAKHNVSFKKAMKLARSHPEDTEQVDHQTHLKWVDHVKAHTKKHNMTFKDASSDAKATYKK